MENSNLSQFYFAPLQESTDFVYRSAFNRHFGSVDKFFAPYLVVQNDGSIKKSHRRDLLPENNPDYYLVPQLMAGNSKDFLSLAKILTDWGYSEINWNLGCPYPMVTKRGMGAGLLSFPEKIDLILEEVLSSFQGKLSIKIRLGLLSPDEIFNLTSVLNKYPLFEVIVHPRTAHQMFNGVPDIERFKKVVDQISLPVVYNGDILTVEDWKHFKSEFTSQHNMNYMVGRGFLKNPFLPFLLKGNSLPGKREKIKKLQDFHQDVIEGYSRLLSGDSHLLIRMTKFWEYFSYSFPDAHKSYKRVKKAVNRMKYDAAVIENFKLYMEE